MAFTFTSTSTFTRTELIEVQVRAALRRTTDISAETLDRLMGGIENRWVEKFLVYGFDSRSICRAELELQIDWGEYGAQISAGRTKVTIDQRWADNTAIEVDEVIHMFNRCVKGESLRTEWRVFFTPDVYRNEALLRRVQEALGVRTAPPVTWAGQRIGKILGIEELPEVKIGLYMEG